MLFLLNIKNTHILNIFIIYFKT